MNDRLQALADQATEDILGVPILNQKLFAELIVRECAEVCDAYGMPDNTSPTAMILSKAIKNKFGIDHE